MPWARSYASSNAKIICFDPSLPVDSIKYLIENYGSKIYLDPLSDEYALKIKPYIDKIFAIKPNKTELEILSDMKINTEDDKLDLSPYGNYLFLIMTDKSLETFNETKFLAKINDDIKKNLRIYYKAEEKVKTVKLKLIPLSAYSPPSKILILLNSIFKP